MIINLSSQDQPNTESSEAPRPVNAKTTEEPMIRNMEFRIFLLSQATYPMRLAILYVSN
jgi:hypothetical protein